MPTGTLEGERASSAPDATASNLYDSTYSTASQEKEAGSTTGQEALIYARHTRRIRRRPAQNFNIDIIYGGIFHVQNNIHEKISFKFEIADRRELTVAGATTIKYANSSLGTKPLGRIGLQTSSGCPREQACVQFEVSACNIKV